MCQIASPAANWLRKDLVLDKFRTELSAALGKMTELNLSLQIKRKRIHLSPNLAVVPSISATEMFHLCMLYNNEATFPYSANGNFSRNFDIRSHFAVSILQRTKDAGWFGNNGHAGSTTGAIAEIGHGMRILPELKRKRLEDLKKNVLLVPVTEFVIL